MVIGLLTISLGSKCTEIKCNRNYNINCENNSSQFDYSRKYVLKTLDNMYVQSCIGCVGGVAECFDGGLQAVKDEWNGDSVTIQSNNITMNIKSIDKNLVMKTITNPKSSDNVVCLTSSDVRDCNTNLRLIIYKDSNRNEEKIYRIKSNNGTFVGIREGVLGNYILTDGFTEPNCHSIFKLDRL
jgi:hypothetical protein